MNECLSNIFFKELELLKRLFNLLKEQNKRIIGSNIYLVEEIIKDLRLTNKEIATLEVERMKVLGGKKLSEVLNICEDNNLINMYKEISEIVSKIQNVNKTNEILLKQKIYLNSRLLNLITPSDDVVGIYDCFGRVKN